jgi:phosphoglucosamine mutase
MARKYFGTDGIRGRANVKITPDMALRVGQAAGLAFRRGERRHRMVIGKGTRLSSYMIEYALVAGLTSSGRRRAASGTGSDPGGRLCSPAPFAVIST